MGVANTKLFYYDGILKLMYNNGEACHNGQKRQTHIAFICSPHAPFQGTGRPKFVHEDHCIYHFRWPTKFACPAQVSHYNVLGLAGLTCMVALSRECYKVVL